MRKFLFLLLVLPLTVAGQQATVKIHGYVSDFENNRIAGATVAIINSYWQAVDSAQTDIRGYYELHVPKGEYMAMTGMVSEEYPRANAVPEEDMRLEFWVWNLVADRDLELEVRYHRLELYGTTVFELHGAHPGFFVYFRPMGVSKLHTYEKHIWLDKALGEKLITDISVDPEHLQVWVYADEEELKVNHIQRIEEFAGEGQPMMGAYLLHVDRPKRRTQNPYIIFRVVAKDSFYNDIGENLYFYKIPEFYLNMRKQH